MYKSLASLLLLTAVCCQVGNSQNQNSINGMDPKLLEEIFGKPSNETTQPQTTTQTPLTTAPNINNKFGNTTEELVCGLEDGSEGVCVPFYLCSKNNTVITDGTGILDVRFGESAPACTSYLHMCCALADRTTEPITPKPDPPRVGCGWRNPKGADMRTTGETEGETKFGEFPWMVAVIQIQSEGNQEFQLYAGGGSLIHPSVVLTAAHAVYKANSLKIRAGEWDTQTEDEIYPYQDRNVASKEVHKDFNKGNLFYDVAVLFLEKPVDLAPNVGVACLPPPRQRTTGGTRCFATGWGKNKFGKEGRYQVILKKVEVPVVDNYSCQTALRTTRLGRLFMLHTSFMCAGGEKGKDTCKGDGGSPLSCPIEYEEDRFMQSGIVAWGIGCGEDGRPGVYVDVSIMRDWIDDKVAGKGYDPTTYTY